MIWYGIFFTHFSVDGHLVCFHVLAAVNHAAMSTEAHVSFFIMVFSGYMPSSGIVGSCASCISRFLRKLHAVFHGGCIDVQSHRQCVRVPFSSHPLRHYGRPGVKGRVGEIGGSGLMRGHY